MHFLYASDEGFSDVLCASIRSLLLHHRGTNLTVHVVGEGLSEQTSAAIQELFDEHGQTVLLLEMPPFEAIFGREIDPKRFTLSAFSRLFADSLVDASVDRIIYLDCDTIVQSNLADLWNFELGTAVIGAVDDCRSWRYLAHLGLPRQATYINSGVLLIDLVKYREGQWQKEFEHAIATYDGLLEFPDNDLICMLMQDHLAVLPPRFNMISPVRTCTYSEVKRLRQPNHYYSRAEFEHSKANPAILHYTTYFALRGRPWNKGYDPTDSAAFLEHFTAIGGRLRPEKPVSFVKRVAQACIRGPLRPLALSLIGFVHAVIKPLMGRKDRARIHALQTVDA